MPRGRGYPAAKCKVERCDRNVASHGMCSVHWRRFQHHGHTDLLPRPRQPYLNTNGYVYERVEGQRQGVLQHRLVMERKLGRPLLPGESVHHRNGIKTDNDPRNLELWVSWQPHGCRVQDLLAWAQEIISRYG